MMAEVLVNLPVKRLYRAFTYHLPEALAHLGVGWRVLVPFGGRRVEGFIIAISETSELPAAKVKDILAAVDDEAWFTPEMLAVARWLAAFYLCAPAEMMRLFMPGKSGVRMEASYRVHLAMEAAKARDGDEGQRALYTYLQAKGEATLADLRRAFPKVPARSDVVV